MILQELAEPIVAEVGDSTGPLAGITVVFSTLTGTPEEKAVPASAVSDSLGRVSTRWTMGRWSGERILGVEVLGLLSTAAFAQVSPGPAHHVSATVDLPRVLLGGGIHTAVFGQVSDTFENPIPGVPVRFVVDSGGGQVLGLSDTDTSRADRGFSFLWKLGPLARRQLAHIDAGSLRSPPLLVLGTIGQVVVVAGDSQRTRPGKPVPNPVIVRATNRDGLVLGAGFPVRFIRMPAGVGFAVLDSAVTDSAGQAQLATPWVLEPTPGWQRLVVQGELEESAAFVVAEAVAPKPARIDLVVGGNQRGAAGNFVPVLPQVIVRDSSGAPMGDQPILTEIVGPRGVTRSFAAHRSDSLGRATVASWRLGGHGESQLRISTPGLPPSPVLVTATADSLPPRGFGIETRFHGVFPIWIAPRVPGAVAAWERVIIGDLPSEFVDLPADPSGCHPAVKATIDDILVFVAVRRGDGPGKSVADARVCRYRAGSDLPLISQVILDHDDLVNIEESVGLEPVLVHMIGHALGFGDAWSRRPGLIDGARFRYFGAAAVQAANWARWSVGTSQEPTSWVNLGDGFDPSSTKHWSITLAPDVMSTGILRTSRISVVTAAAMRDLGYQVDDTKAAEIFAPLATPPAAGASWAPDHVIRPLASSSRSRVRQ